MTQTEPKVTGCTCDFSGGTRGMDRCARCAGTGSRFVAVVNGETYYYPNTWKGYEDARRRLDLSKGLPEKTKERPITPEDLCPECCSARAAWIGDPTGHRMWRCLSCGHCFESEAMEYETTEENNVSDIIDKITEERGGTYGPFISNAVISQALKGIMRHHPASKYMTLPHDMQEALDQYALKISRILTGDAAHLDNWDDIAGYSKCVTDRLRKNTALKDAVAARHIPDEENE